MSVNLSLSCVLFDLDGTLVDTAPDLIAALNRALHNYGFEAVSIAAIKPYISYGAAAMIAKSLPENNHNEQLQSTLLDYMLSSYQNHIAEKSRLFTGMADILESIEKQGLKWGVVTNKRERFTKPLMDELQLTHRAACIISGDSTANSKPHPEPMFKACKQANVKPKECVYIGDAAHDIEAGRRAEMQTLAAVYGYLKPDDQPENWGADALIKQPAEIANWFEQQPCP
jgi:phosphoglycolate phosphatase